MLMHSFDGNPGGAMPVVAYRCSIGNPGQAATRPRQTGDKAGTDRVDGLREHHRHGAARPLHGLPSAASGDKHDVRRQCDQFVGPLAKALIIEWSPTVVEPQVATDGPAQRLQSLL